MIISNDNIDKYSEEGLDLDAPTTEPISYLPHKAVVNLGSSNKLKLRTVFEGSAKCGRDKMFLNDCLLNGSKLVQLRIACMMNFKANEYAFTINLEKKFSK